MSEHTTFAGEWNGGATKLTTKPCRRGHVISREKDGHCPECRRQGVQRRHAENPEKERSRGRKRHLKNGSVINARHRKARVDDPERYRNYGQKYRNANPERIMLRAAKYRAQTGGYLCTITEADIIIPERCPLLKTKFERGCGVGQTRPSSPSLDRINPKLGYVPGNVWVISHRANSIKRDATLKELQLLVSNWSTLHGD
jgi:hypothetical protein